MEKNYFNIENILKKYKIDWKTASIILCINAIRNIGKTTNVLGWTMDLVDESNKIAFIRNSEEQLKTFRMDFNNRFYGRFMISANCIYNVIEVIVKNKDGEDVVSYKKNKLVGYCGSLSAYTKIKSIEAANIRFVVFDEYNEDGLYIRDIYTKFINMIKTLTRFSKVFIIMLGNRDTPNNEFMVKWGVTPEDNDFREDWFYKFSERGYFIELGSEQFENLGNDKTLANELASFDKNADRYLKGGYAGNSFMQVVPYYKVINNTFNPLFKIAMGNVIYAFGEFTHHKIGEAYALVENEDAVAKAYGLKSYSLDNASYQHQDTKLNTKESQYNILERMLRLHKKKLLYYDTFNSMVELTQKMVLISY